MKKILNITGLILVSCYCFCQVPTDSLPGTYVGQFWFANPNTSSWVITPDTLFVVGVDTINCRDTTYSTNGYFNGIPIFYTTYNYCNTPVPSNGYSLFYAADSLRMVYDNIPQPYPNSPVSERFYGKRISGSLLVGIMKLELSQKLEVFPNPCFGILNILSEVLNDKAQIVITDITGREIKKDEIRLNEKTQYDVSDLPGGVYFLIIKTSEGIFNKKLIISK